MTGRRWLVLAALLALALLGGAVWFSSLGSHLERQAAGAASSVFMCFDGTTWDRCQGMGAIPIGLAVALVVIHFIGDFPAQSAFGFSPEWANWMAREKAKRMEALACHVIVYAAPLFVGTFLLDPTGHGGPQFFLTNAIAHWVTDALSSRVNARLYRRYGMGHYFWLGIGADQLIHVVTLLVTASWWLT